MDKWSSVFQALMQTEETILPLFVHNPNSQKIAAIVMLAESAVAAILPQVAQVVKTPAAPAPSLPVNPAAQ